jgi:cation/acetate symporter
VAFATILAVVAGLTMGAVAGIVVGLLSCLIMVALGPTVIGPKGPVVQGRPPDLPMGEPGDRLHPARLRGRWLGTLLSREPSSDERYEELHTRAFTGLRAEEIEAVEAEAART